MKRWHLITIAVVAFVAALFGWANHNENPLPADVRADSIVVEKSKRLLVLNSQGQILKRYKISLGLVPVGAKQGEGDKKTPEGRYFIDFRKVAHLQLF